jgi:hypothetical protein
MLLRASGWILAGSIVCLAHVALASNFSTALKNFYTEYEVVKQCQIESQLSPADAGLAKGAIDKIEAYYLQRDASIDKAHLMQQAVANKDDGFRIATRNSNAGDLRDFCRVSLKELLEKAEEVDPTGKG